MRWIRSDGLTGLAVPMVVWAVHFLAVYVIAGLACARGWSASTFAAITSTSWLLLACGAAAIVLLVLLARRVWPNARGLSLRTTVDGPRRSRTAFVAAATLALCALSAIGIVFTTLPVVMLPLCQ